LRNLNYFRDYDPQTGRYLESDPIGLDGGINTYGYALQNPLYFIDPSGLAKTTIEAAIEQALRRGDLGELQELLGASVSDSETAAARAAIKRLQTKAQDIILKECRGSINREFPNELKENTLEEIFQLEKQGNPNATKALKLLRSNEYKK
jgi:uncharacterized protein RhaS with RHS repeats